MEYPKNNNHADQLCPYFDICDLIQNHVEKLPGLIDRFKERYCFNKHLMCSRRWIGDFLGPDKVPELMMPQQRDWAEQVLFESGVRYTAFQEKFGGL